MAENVENIYARSLFELAVEEKRLEEIQAEMTALSQVFLQTPDFIRLLSSPAVSKAEKEEMIGKVFDGRTEALLVNFLKVLAQNGRIAYFERISRVFTDLYRKEKNILAVTAVTAVPLNDALRDKLCVKLTALTGKRIELSEEVVPSILGGILLRYDHREIDGTVREKLAGLRRQLNRQVMC